jgi:formiminoglutamase
MSLVDDPRWPRASKWLACGDHDGDALGLLTVLGVPACRGSITPGRCDLGPGAIRKALERFSTYDLRFAVDLGRTRVRDLGTLDMVAELNPAAAKEIICTAVTHALRQGNALAIFGGDNSITYPAVRGMADACTGGALERCAVLTLDAHFDLRDTEAGLSNGNPIRALLEEGLPGRSIAQIGILPFANSRDYARVARDAGIAVITADEVHAQGIQTVVRSALDELAARADAIYVDLDLDVLDRSFAPATPGSRPGGLYPWQISCAARECGMEPKVRAIDLVEIDPTRDIADATVLSAATCFLSWAAGVAQRLRSANAEA